uniref:AlNc14C467G11811 protein n=1 Tax=Albugo laibachii Nc14 TaxID=890382 RepID=F0X073_9STRA|nr:AlNc14C467G11811 [Albugo laibachii Nc14]|eukprot:CCA27155.1 AlNc14C467G11811 [Albugo laibachii Nc14]
MMRSPGLLAGEAHCDGLLVCGLTLSQLTRNGSMRSKYWSIVHRNASKKPDRRYTVKLGANGTLCSVVLADHLPVSKKNSTQLLCSCTPEPNELWVSVLEKAYFEAESWILQVEIWCRFDCTQQLDPRASSIISLQSDWELMIWAQLESVFDYAITSQPRL